MTFAAMPWPNVAIAVAFIIAALIAWLGLLWYLANTVPVSHPKDIFDRRKPPKNEEPT